DGTEALIEGFRNALGVIHFSKSNVGFCTAQNRLISPAASEYVLILNPDVILDSNFLKIMVREMDGDPRAGSASGRLWRWQTESADLEHFLAHHQSRPKILDSAGIFLTPNQRHLDRGSGETDGGQYARREYVFGASGAAAFCRRAMLQDIADGPRYFDENFFAYREDADLAWRAQWLGWRCLYVPEATGYHARRVLPERRSSLPDAINMHSFKNRFLLRIKSDPGICSGSRKIVAPRNSLIDPIVPANLGFAQISSKPTARFAQANPLMVFLSPCGATNSRLSMRMIEFHWKAVSRGEGRRQR
ncbi:MAG: glycosyl transferase, family 2, partial [Acidobacteria bacterium]|nr:glycosyl transferase, family 2 [Acidobacteriota bacterium]